MAGTAEDSIRAQLGTGAGQGTVFLAQVQADAQGAGQGQVVIDDQSSAVLPAEVGQGGGFVVATIGVP